jgi:hypothetical protein
MKQLLIVLSIVGALTGLVSAADDLAKNFASPPPSTRPWAFWFWINGNIAKNGITADLEAMKRIGIGGVLWMEVSGMSWAPDGPVTPASPQWHECMQWAVRECERLGLEFDLSVDFGYGSGGPHITPELSMQKLYWSETEVEGGRQVDTVLPKPEVAKKLSAWLRPGATINPEVVEQIEKSDSYRDVAVVAIPSATSPKGRAYRIPEIKVKDGTSWAHPRNTNAGSPPPDAVTPTERVVDLTGRVGADGRLTWDAPPGKWLVLRCGHASNFKMTRPCPQLAVGLECDRLSKAGIETHYDGFLKKIFTDAGPAAGKALNYVHIDSWEAGGQNWTATFPAEFRARRGYDLRPWLPVLAGRVVGSAELSERFLWDMRTTVSELIRDNYARRLRELAQTHRIRFSLEAYGRLCIDNLSYAGVADMPISEFWAVGDGQFPQLREGYKQSSKALASVAHTGGRQFVGAEAFTGDRGWRDHPYLLKPLGDWAFCEGVNRMIFHLSAHQAYDNMVPGLTHRKWGEHIQRHNTWFEYSRPWMDYLARCQYLLQQGNFVADVCYWFGEGAPLNVNDMTLEIPQGYSLDFCSAGTVLQMNVKEGQIVLPSGASYRYLRLPDADRMTLPLARKIRELVEAGARVIGGPRLKGTPGLTDVPRCDAEVEKIATALWDSNRVVCGKTLTEVFAQDRLQPDFAGEGLRYIHRRSGDTDIYFVASDRPKNVETVCSFRVAGKRPGLWQPETGRIAPVAALGEADGVTRIPLMLEPCGSVFVMFRSGVAPAERLVSVTRNGQELLCFDKPTPKAVAAVNATNTFTIVAWANPSGDTAMPREAVVGTVARLPRNDALYPPPGHEVWGNADAGAGFAVGRNGVCVHEHGAAYFSTSLAYAAALTNWVHVAIVYRDGTPTLYLDGKRVRTGLKSPKHVHPGVGVAHQRKVAPFAGELAGLQAFDRALTESEIVSLARLGPDRNADERRPTFDLAHNRIWQSGDYAIKTADGRTRQLKIELPPPQEITGPWQVTFDPKWGGPAEPVTFAKLDDWSKHAAAAIRYYSGPAVYLTEFGGPRSVAAAAGDGRDGARPSNRVFLDLGSVEVMARVRLNGKDCGIAWKPPYRVDITDAVCDGSNELEISVVNLWINRMIGDEQLPPDANWKDVETLLEWPDWFQTGKPRPSGRFTFSSCRHYAKDSPLVPSGLLGPVTITTSKELQ